MASISDITNFLYHDFTKDKKFLSAQDVSWPTVAAVSTNVGSSHVHGGYPSTGNTTAPQTSTQPVQVNGSGAINTSGYVVSSNIMPGVTITTTGAGGWITPGGSFIPTTPDVELELAIDYSTSADLPTTFFANSLDDSGNEIGISFDPESSITNIELMKIFMMFLAYQDESSYSPYAYIKKQGLERHFKYHEAR